MCGVSQIFCKLRHEKRSAAELADVLHNLLVEVSHVDKVQNFAGLGLQHALLDRAVNVKFNTVSPLEIRILDTCLQN